MSAFPQSFRMCVLGSNGELAEIRALWTLLRSRLLSLFWPSLGLRDFLRY